jgi:predicted alpha/beta superfamily hydrolase
MAFFEVFDWATDLTPWPDPKIDRNPEVGRHAEETLAFVTNTLLPALTDRFGPVPVILGGYSLGGLFALWASMHTDRFAAVAAASPSLWIRDWLPYAQGHPVLASAVYLSLGDREEHVRNTAIARVGDCVRGQYALLQSQLGESACTLRWESGGHFSDNDARLARAFSWCIRNVRM